VKCLSPKKILNFVTKYMWLPGFERALTDVKEYLSSSGEHDPEIDTWRFLAPQLKKVAGDPWKCCGLEFSIRLRSRIETGGRYKVYSEPDHIRAAKYFTGLLGGAILSGGVNLTNSRQGVFLFYPVRSKDDKSSTPTMGFVLLFPTNKNPQQIAYSVADASRSDAVVVPAR